MPRQLVSFAHVYEPQKRIPKLRSVERVQEKVEQKIQIVHIIRHDDNKIFEIVRAFSVSLRDTLLHFVAASVQRKIRGATLIAEMALVGATHKRMRAWGGTIAAFGIIIILEQVVDFAHSDGTMQYEECRGYGQKDFGSTRVELFAACQMGQVAAREVRLEQIRGTTIHRDERGRQQRFQLVIDHANVSYVKLRHN